ncbi:SagB/ThcOx family dehydrogenase [Candidatus Altiarchaeota archaeon]
MMGRDRVLLLAIIGVIIVTLYLTSHQVVGKLAASSGNDMINAPEEGLIGLPEPVLDGGTSVEKAMADRRSVRSYSPGPLSLAEFGQMLWAAQGKTSKYGGRTAPSAGATYPLEVYAVAADVEGLKPGVYKYIPSSHSIGYKVAGDVRKELVNACLSQQMIGKAPASIVITADHGRTTDRYGQRGIMYVHMEAGHAGQNIYLQAEGLGFGTVAIGAFDPKEVADILSLPADEEPLYVFPIGKKG